MTLFAEWNRPPSRDFPCGLSLSALPRLPARWTLLAALLGLALAVRAVAAWRWTVLWDDSVFYLRIVQCLERRDFDGAFSELGLNPYPLILMGLQATGIEWTIVGKWWSVLMAGLTVLPLFGLVRRQFDDQVALAACLLYALHPTFISYTPLIIRDPTYWLTFSLFLYWAWRAVTEVRMGLFAAAGSALTITVLSRLEGWLLVVPLVLWAAWRVPAVPGRRLRLAAGVGVCLAMIPLWLLAINLTWLAGHSRWECGRFNTAQTTCSWLVRQVPQAAPDPEGAAAIAAAAPAAPSAPAPTAPAAAVPAAAAPADAARVAALMVDPGPPGDEQKLPPTSFWTFGRKALLRLVKAFSYEQGLLILIGLAGWWPVFLRRDQQALFVYSLWLFVGVWVHYAQAGNDMRYFLPMVLMGLPYAALGLLWLVERIAPWVQRPGQAAPPRPGTFLVLLVAVGLLGLPHAVHAAESAMRQHGELGRWILQFCGPGRTISDPGSGPRLVEYFAQGHVIPFDPDPAASLDRLREPLAPNGPDVVVLREDGYHHRVYALREPLAAECRRLGYVQVPADQLSPVCREMWVFVRPQILAEPR